jgi:cobalt transporter subunit CbtB
MTTMTAAVSASSFSLSQRLLVGLATLLLGLVLVGGVGFASDMAIHNGAHDTRHALGFPCH